ncbi:MAG: hypothetical protein LBP33_04480 [Candidatus Adiutrix sp.]|jgi:hypothetical protein|nr:hypothetical protein [Candidatus Adiutrix sp.]
MTFSKAKLFFGCLLLWPGLLLGSALWAPASRAQTTTILKAPDSAQNSGPDKNSQPLDKDVLHLNTIGAFSAGFVLQSYGYIGVLADAYGQKIYSPELVRSMLTDTGTYLRNVNSQLKKYQDSDLVGVGDRKFIASVIGIIDQLSLEAEALSAFTQSKKAEDLKRYEEARKNAWSIIRKTFNMK